MMPWLAPNSGMKLPNDLQPERPEPEPEPDPKPEDEILMTDSPQPLAGYESTGEPARWMDYGRGPVLRWSHRKV